MNHYDVQHSKWAGLSSILPNRSYASCTTNDPAGPATMLTRLLELSPDTGPSVGCVVEAVSFAPVTSTGGFAGPMMALMPSAAGVATTPGSLLTQVGGGVPASSVVGN